MKRNSPLYMRGISMLPWPMQPRLMQPLSMQPWSMQPWSMQRWDEEGVLLTPKS